MLKQHCFPCEYSLIADIFVHLLRIKVNAS